MHDRQPIRRKIDSRIVAFGSPAIGCRHIAPHAITVRGRMIRQPNFLIQPASTWVCRGGMSTSSPMTPVVHSGATRNIEEAIQCLLFCLCADNDASHIGQFLFLILPPTGQKWSFWCRGRKKTGSRSYFRNDLRSASVAAS